MVNMSDLDLEGRGRADEVRDWGLEAARREVKFVVKASVVEEGTSGAFEDLAGRVP